MAEFRCRFTDLEIKFFIEALKSKLETLDAMEKTFKQLEHEVYTLKKQARYDTSVWKRLKEAKEQWDSIQGYGLVLLNYRTACNLMIRKLESVLNGGRLHNKRYYLQKIYSVPKDT